MPTWNQNSLIPSRNPCVLVRSPCGSLHAAETLPSMPTWASRVMAVQVVCRQTARSPTDLHLSAKRTVLLHSPALPRTVLPLSKTRLTTDNIVRHRQTRSSSHPVASGGKTQQTKKKIFRSLTMGTDDSHPCSVGGCGFSFVNTLESLCMIEPSFQNFRNSLTLCVFVCKLEM